MAGLSKKPCTPAGLLLFTLAMRMLIKARIGRRYRGGIRRRGGIGIRRLGWRCRAGWRHGPVGGVRWRWRRFRPVTTDDVASTPPREVEGQGTAIEPIEGLSTQIEVGLPPAISALGNSDIGSR